VGIKFGDDAGIHTSRCDDYEMYRRAYPATEVQTRDNNRIIKRFYDIMFGAKATDVAPR
jgi:hypothetical protein